MYNENKVEIYLAFTSSNTDSYENIICTIKDTKYDTQLKEFGWLGSIHQACFLLRYNHLQGIIIIETIGLDKILSFLDGGLVTERLGTYQR